MKLGLGTVQFGTPYGISNKSGQVDAAEVGKILQLAASSGIQILDTAAGYGNSETVLGASLAPAHNFSIVTKILPLKTDPIRPEDVARLEKAFYDSLRHLGQSSVYGLLVHHPADLLSSGGERLYALLQSWRAEGLVGKIGVSVYDKDEVDCLFGKYAFDLVQLPLNVFDQRLVHNGTLKRLHQAGVEIHVRSAFLQGLLLMPSAALPPYFASLKPHHEAYLDVLAKLGLSPVAGALGYFHRLPEISTVLVGVETSTHLQECLVATREIPLIDFAGFSVDNPIMLDPRVWR